MWIVYRLIDHNNIYVEYYYGQSIGRIYTLQPYQWKLLQEDACEVPISVYNDRIKHIKLNWDIRNEVTESQ